jgi:phenylacetate-CoA ligase
LNPYHNPIFLTKLLKSYLTDINRIWHITPDKLHRYQDKAFRKMLKYAYTVPVYHKKYKKTGVHPNDISGIKDIKKLPVITKNDIRNSYPNGIVPNNFNKDHAYLVSTSGSSGKPVYCYYSLLTAIKVTEGCMRSLRPIGAKWNKSRICLIVDMKEGSAEKAAYDDSIIPFLNKFISTDNLLYLHVGDPFEKILEKLKKFNPEYLVTDPNMLQQLAYLKNDGKLDYLNPKWLYSGSAMLDAYTRNYVEKSFGIKIFDNYNTTEVGPIAFQCLKEGYHVNSDYVFLEFLDEEGNDVGYNKPGSLLVSRLYGLDTPFIRYSGIEDIITSIKPSNCCGVTTTQMIKNINGRSMDFIHLPSGKKIAPFKVTTIPASIMDELNTFKIRQFQIIQHSINELEVKIIFDEKQKNKKPTEEIICKKLKEKFKQETFNEIDIVINEVKDISKDEESRMVKVIVSKLNK